MPIKNIISLADKTDDAKFISPEQMLQESLREIEEKEIQGKKALLILLDDEDGYRITWRNAGMKASEMVTLGEVLKIHGLEFLGFL